MKEQIARIETKIDHIAEKLDVSYALTHENADLLNKFKGGLAIFGVLGSVAGVLKILFL